MLEYHSLLHVLLFNSILHSCRDTGVRNVFPSKGIDRRKVITQGL